MRFPQLDDATRVEKLRLPTDRARMLLDTDAFSMQRAPIFRDLFTKPAKQAES